MTEEKLYVDFACGQNRPTDTTTPAGEPCRWVGIDRADIDGVDIVHDLTVFPWPLDDASVDGGRCSHYLEHIPLADTPDGVDLLLAWFDELHRVLKPGAQVEIITPYWNSVRAWQDPTHRRPITEYTYLYAQADKRAEMGLSHYPVSCDFDFTYGYGFSDQRWANSHEDAKQFALLHYTNVVSDLVVYLTKR